MTTDNKQIAIEILSKMTSRWWDFVISDPDPLTMIERLRLARTKLSKLDDPELAAVIDNLITIHIDTYTSVLSYDNAVKFYMKKLK